MVVGFIVVCECLPIEVYFIVELCKRRLIRWGNLQYLVGLVVQDAENEVIVSEADKLLRLDTQ